MPIENTDLERRVLAHEQILQALMAQMAEGQPRILERMQQRFATARRGAHEHDYIETADYAEAFLHEVARLVRVQARPGESGVVEPRTLPHAAAPSATPATASVIIHTARIGGVWHVTRDGEFIGDYLAEAPARAAAAHAARAMEHAGRQVEIAFGPHL